MIETISVVRLALSLLNPWYGLKRKVSELESTNRALELRNAALEQQLVDTQLFLLFAFAVGICAIIVLGFAFTRRPLLV